MHEYTDQSKAGGGQMLYKVSHYVHADTKRSTFQFGVKISPGRSLCMWQNVLQSGRECSNEYLKMKLLYPLYAIIAHDIMIHKEYSIMSS